MRFEAAGLKKSIDRLAKARKTNKQEVCRRAAKGFLKTIISVTPPAHDGVTGQAAKQAGEQTIQADILKIAQPVFVDGRAARKALATAGEIMAAHDRLRTGARGRVNPRNRKEKLFALQAVVIGVIRKLQKEVGWLAAGWLKACAKYGVAVPAWIKRHGSAPGEAVETSGLSTFRINIGNDIEFVGNVKGLDRRIKFALLVEENKMGRQAEFLEQKALKSAGF